MGVRLQIFAVDEPRFEALIEKPLSAALLHYSQQGANTENRLYFWDVRRELEFSAFPSRLSIRSLKPPVEERIVEWNDVKQDSFLSTTSLRDYLANDSDVSLKILLSRFSECRDVDYIKEISSGYRRWWIGSLLDSAEQAEKVSAERYAEVVAIFQKLLCGYDCGKALPVNRWTPAPASFPVVPRDSSEMGVWTSKETQRVIQFLHELRGAAPSFKKPPGRIGIAVETDFEWNAWVHAMIDQLLKLEAMNFKQMKVVSFIG